MNSAPSLDPRVAFVAAAHEAAVKAVEAVDALGRHVSGYRDERLVEGAGIAAMNLMAATQQLSRILGC
jgi:hypothetical protein